jgi:hypothetical protein
MDHIFAKKEDALLCPRIRLVTLWLGKLSRIRRILPPNAVLQAQTTPLRSLAILN